MIVVTSLFPKWDGDKSDLLDIDHFVLCLDPAKHCPYYEYADEEAPDEYSKIRVWVDHKDPSLRKFKGQGDVPRIRLEIVRPGMPRMPMLVLEAESWEEMEESCNRFAADLQGLRPDWIAWPNGRITLGGLMENAASLAVQYAGLANSIKWPRRHDGGRTVRTVSQ